MTCSIILSVLPNFNSHLIFMHLCEDGKEFFFGVLVHVHVLSVFLTPSIRVPFTQQVDQCNQVLLHFVSFYSYFFVI